MRPVRRTSARMRGCGTARSCSPRATARRRVRSLSAAAAYAAELGADGLVARARTVMTDAGLAGETPRSVLTSREEQVLELVAEGLSNGQIAERLYISVEDRVGARVGDPAQARGTVTHRSRGDLPSHGRLTRHARRTAVAAASGDGTARTAPSDVVLGRRQQGAGVLAAPAGARLRRDADQDAVGGASFVTTAFAPTTEPSPIVIGPEDLGAGADRDAVADGGVPLAALALRPPSVTPW